MKYITVENPEFAFGMQRYLFSDSHRKLAFLCARLLLLSPGWVALGGVPESPCRATICGRLSDHGLDDLVVCLWLENMCVMSQMQLP